MKSIRVAIYELRDPEDGQTHYVGKSIHPKKRLLEHLEDVKARPDSAKARWITALRAQGKRPQLHVAEWVAFDDWVKAEAEAIRRHWLNRSPLTNVVMPSGTARPPRPETYIRSQDYWDDLSPTCDGVQRRMFPFKHPEGYGLTVLFNLDDRGWRYGYDLFAGGHKHWFDHIVQPYPRGYPAGFRTLIDLVKSCNWYEEALLDSIFHVRPETSKNAYFDYDHMSPVELFAPEQFGYWPTSPVHVTR